MKNKCFFALLKKACQPLKQPTLETKDQNVPASRCGGKKIRRRKMANTSLKQSDVFR